MQRLDAFMAQANAAYYARKDPFADFTTAPELTQVFGEIIGLWAAVVWQSMGSPASFVLAEAGPGRGTLMTDALRAAGRVPGFTAAARLHLVETSPRLRAEQATRLPGAVWHDRVEDLPDGPLILVANEFLDAMPIRQFVRAADGWRERHVAEGRFVDVPTAEALPDAAAGTIIERRDPVLAAHLGARLAGTIGAALFLDYGPARSGPGDSLQALRDGRPADPLAEPGSADLTAHVDFQAFAADARGAVAFGPVPQGEFLLGLGLFPRSHTLARAQPPGRAAALIEAANRLADPVHMGRLFKALALCHPGLPTPPGFEV
jgi:SAM-dependent MidA family methyltransferase